MIVVELDLNKLGGFQDKGVDILHYYCRSRSHQHLLFILLFYNKVIIFRIVSWTVYSSIRIIIDDNCLYSESITITIMTVV